MPPIGYPGNSISKEARAKAGGGFESAIESAGSNWVEGQVPTIEAVTGSFTEGQTATITVGNMSAKRSGQLTFIDFESEVVGDVVTSIEHANFNASYAQYRGETETPVFGTKYARCHAIQTRPDQAGIVFDSDQNELFMECWHRHQRPDFTAVDVAQIKFFRFVPGTTIGEIAQSRSPTLNTTQIDGSAFQCQARPETVDPFETWSGNLGPSTNRWAPWSYYLKLGTLNTADGKRYIKVDTVTHFENSSNDPGHMASPNDVVARTAWDGEEIVIDNGTLDGQLRRVLVPYFTRDDQETILDIDRLFINDSPERVVVGDADTFLGCTSIKRFVLNQLSRSGNQIQVEVDSLGPLATGPVYLYVFNRDGLYNENGYLWRAS